MASKAFPRVLRDPLYGDIILPGELLGDLLDTPEFQRLRYIHQLGMCSWVFYGAEHSRFQHSVGTMWLMCRILNHWKQNAFIKINTAEFSAAAAAALLHDIGHGPFSHALENVFALKDHEEIGLEIVSRRLAPLIKRHKVDPAMVLGILNGEYPQPIFHELLSSQLDVDRMDYLQRDALYTGAKYGIFDIDRIISALLPIRDQEGKLLCAVSRKGTEAVEAYIFSRYFMYWQVYLHKMVRASETLLRVILERAKLVFRERPQALYLPPNLEFLFREEHKRELDDDFLDHYQNLDDTDIHHAIKMWSGSSDSVLADLARHFVERRPFKALDHPGDAQLEHIKRDLQKVYGPNWEWYVRRDNPCNRGYNPYDPLSPKAPIRIWSDKDHNWTEISAASRTEAVKSLSQTVSRPLLVVGPEAYPTILKWLKTDLPYQGTLDLGL